VSGGVVFAIATPVASFFANAAIAASRVVAVRRRARYAAGAAVAASVASGAVALAAPGNLKSFDQLVGAGEQRRRHFGV